MRLNISQEGAGIYQWHKTKFYGLFYQQGNNVDGYKDNAHNNGGVKQPFFGTASGLDNVAGAAKHIRKSRGFVLQDNYQN